MKQNILIIFSIILLTSCTKGFEDLNTNPNAPTSADPAALFAKAQLATFNNGNIYVEGLQHIYTWTQQFSRKNVTNNIFQRSEFSSGVSDGFWGQYYISAMPNLVDLKRKMEAEPADLKAKHVNRLAMVKIMIVLNTHWLTDAFGGIPYSDAFNAFNFEKQNFLSKYDLQKEVYYAMLATLKEAASSLTTTGQENFSSDLYYSGNIEKWKKLANSLRLRLAMRISKVDEAKAKSEITDLLSNPGNLMASNSDNLIFRFTGTNFDNPLYGQAQSFFHETGASKNLVDFLSSTGDPRLRIFFNKASQGAAAGMYEGVPVSPDARDASGLFATGSTKDYSAKYSRAHAAAWFNRKMPEVGMNYAEVLLLRAEIAQRGWSAENAEQLYNDGIKASVEFYSALYKEAIPNGDTRNPSVSTDPQENLDISTLNVTDAEITALQQAPNVKYSSATALNQIGIQQWINLHRNPLELMSNFRRTDIPNATSVPQWETIKAAGATIPYSSVPRRLTYPGSEYASNKTNLQNFISVQGADVITTKLWWDVE